MAIEFRKLRHFVKVVDTGSISRAASILRIAQPALSQQIVSLETHFRQKLLIRSNRGIVPTEAGLLFYRHAQTILKQFDQAQLDMSKSASTLGGRVSIGLGTYCALPSLSLNILSTMLSRHPNITVHITDSFGYIISESIMTGRMDLAAICGLGPIKGVQLSPLFHEELFLVLPKNMLTSFQPDTPVQMRQLNDLRILLPGNINYLRTVLNEAFIRARVTPSIVADIESTTVMGEAVAAGMGATILPLSVAHQLGIPMEQIRPLSHPKVEVPTSLCVSDHLPMSEPVAAAREVLLEVVNDFVQRQTQGVRRA